MKILFLLLVTLPATAYGDYCRESKIIEQEFDAAGLSQVQLKALAGDLEITPSSSDKITFWGRVCTDSEKHLNMIDLDIIKEGGKLTLAAIIPYHQDEFDPHYASIDIEFAVPEDLDTTVSDSSGDMIIEGVSVSSIEDSSGNIRVLGGKSNLKVRDSSGNITLRGNEGNVSVSDSSGDIDLRGVDGDVEIPGDSSGDIDLERVSGSINIRRDGSGDITIENVGQDVVIGSDGAGDIEIEEVQGQVRIGADGSGEVEVTSIAGDFELKSKGNGDIRVRDIDGKIDTPSN